MSITATKPPTQSADSSQGNQKRNTAKPRPSKQSRNPNQNQTQNSEPRNRRERRPKADLPTTPKRQPRDKTKKQTSERNTEQELGQSKPHNGDLNLNNDLRSRGDGTSKSPRLPRTPAANAGTLPKDKGPNTSFSGNSFHASPAASSLPRPTFRSPAKHDTMAASKPQVSPTTLPGVAHYGQTMMPPFALPPNQGGSPAMYAYPVGPQGVYAMPPVNQQWPYGGPQQMNGPQPLGFPSPGPYVMLNPNQHPLPGPGQSVPLPIPGYFAAPPPVAHPAPKMGVTDPRLFAK